MTKAQVNRLAKLTQQMRWVLKQVSVRNDRRYKWASQIRDLTWRVDRMHEVVEGWDGKLKQLSPEATQRNLENFAASLAQARIEIHMIKNALAFGTPLHDLPKAKKRKVAK